MEIDIDTGRSFMRRNNNQNNQIEFEIEDKKIEQEEINEMPTLSLKKDPSYSKPAPPKYPRAKKIGISVKTILLFVKLAIALIFLKKLGGPVDVQHFTRSVFGIYLLYVLIYEPIVLAIFTCLFIYVGARSKWT